jgi:hypothetical protein
MIVFSILTTLEINELREELKNQNEKLLTSTQLTENLTKLKVELEKVNDEAQDKIQVNNETIDSLEHTV